ncbi:MarR family transcriptional regulator [Roseomonas sp. KE2513]|uniref:MarR family transcriptional regulator n=1 Tax=Roseomonas sp. KE2513 TaxID=2479202 RepID=UPI0018E056DC|nr:MarR family transcriptional regulator [Roseomonas sp. KE2513]MBI0538476.1 MarR family transcriptional regulator [Roseomonas sp. KE2513]
MIVQGTPDQFIEILRETIVSLVRRDGPDLTARQLSIFLIVHLGEGPHTVRGLASALNVPKASVTRGLDRLSKFELTRRKTDPQDRRSVLVQRTSKGTALAREIQAIMGEAASAMEQKPSSRKGYAGGHTH